MVQEQNFKNFRAELCARTIKNGNLKRMFRNADEIAKLGEKSGLVMARLFDISSRLNKMGAKDVEDLTKK